MHEIQRQLLELAQTHNLRALGLREIGRLLDEEKPIHPQKVKHHLQQLNLLEKPTIEKKDLNDIFVSIPIYGWANCGPATFFANWADPVGHIQVSRRLFQSYSPDLFAVQAIGSSLNRANINGKNIQSGDYVVVDPKRKDFKDGDYVLSVINEMANLKRFTRTADGGIALISESSESFPPVFIHPKDMDTYVPSAKVVEVFKHPKIATAEEDIVLEELA